MKIGDSQAYCISEHDYELIKATAALAPGPALVIQVDRIGDCGERDLVGDIADMVYDKNVARGLHRSDGKERHFSFIDLSFDSDPQDIAVFSDHLWRANPFVDDFYGLDAISLLSWPTANGDAWRALGRHVRENARTTDFVFVMKPGAAMAENLMDALTGEWGVPTEVIEVAPPTQEMLLSRILSRAPSLSQEQTGAIRELVARESTRHPDLISYTWADRLATKAVLELGRCEEVPAQTFEELAATLRVSGKSHIGF